MAPHNIFRTPRVSLAVGFHPQTNIEAFKAYFGNCIELTLLHTNRGRRIAAAKNVPWKPVSAVELDAFLELQIIAGALKAGHRNTCELWDNKDDNPIFRATMSFRLFQQIKSALRFDNKLRRNTADPLAPIRDVVELMNRNLATHYVPGSLLCIHVDEQLIEFHGRVHFKQYIPSKPGKFGMKVFWLTDVENMRCFPCAVWSI